MGKARGFPGWALRAFCVVSVIGLLSLTFAVEKAEAGNYDPKKAGNPLRIVAYALHPVGVALDYALMRPCFYVVKREPFSTIFGYVPPRHEDLSEHQQPRTP